MPASWLPPFSLSVGQQAPADDWLTRFAIAAGAAVVAAVVLRSLFPDDR